MNFDFKDVEQHNFKEDSVREFIIAPLLKELGFVNESKNSKNKLEMALSVKITTPTILGSNEKKILTRFPDYILYLDKKPHCVLDAKAPSKEINPQSDAERQVFYYAINVEIKAPYYALCNGKLFNLYETNGQNLLYSFECEELFKNNNENFKHLKQILSTPINSLRQDFQSKTQKIKKDDNWYLSRELPKVILKPKKQAKARHFGCTAYFTRQSWDIVTQNIKNFTDEGDVVLDSFGGSGVTAIEAMMNARLGIHTDLNPLSIFMVKALSAKVNLGEFYDLSEEILKEFESLRPKNEKEAKALLKNAQYYANAIDLEFGKTATQKEQDAILWIPKDETLPKGSDVEFVLQLFTKKQLAELAILRKLIFRHTTPSGTKEQRIDKKNMRYSLLLAFYNTLSNINLIYHTSNYNTENKTAGSCAAFLYYRYRIAKEPVLLDTIETFRRKIQRVLKGKQELENENAGKFYPSYFAPLQGVIKDFEGSLIEQRINLEQSDSILDRINGEKIFQADATNLKEIESKSVDFIYTDPPYGAKIPYLDLSTMWNVWLDLPVNESLKEKECIEKGSLEKTRYEYHDLMKASLKEMYRVLKYNRWLAFVFQHQDPQLWQILIDEAQNIGFEYVGSIRQENGQTTFKKRQYKASVLSGQLIIYFKKVQNPKSLIKENLGDDLVSFILNHAEALIVRDEGASLEEIHAEITIKGLELGFLHELSKDYADLTPLINENFELDETNGKYHIKKGQKFKSNAIALESRAKYFLLSYLRGTKRQGKKAMFDDMCLEIIPLLKNGVSPDEALIKQILEQIAVPIKDSNGKETGEYRLKEQEASLFDGLE